MKFFRNNLHRLLAQPLESFDDHFCLNLGRVLVVAATGVRTLVSNLRTSHLTPVLFLPEGSYL